MFGLVMNDKVIDLGRGFESHRRQKKTIREHKRGLDGII